MAETVEVATADRAELVARATSLLRDGQLVVLPTDTAYGVAADAFDLDGTARLAAAKDRPRTVPVTVLVRSPKQLIGLTPQVGEAAEALMAAFWPGPLTLVVAAESSLRWDVGRTGGSVAVRMPLDELALEVIRSVGPLAVSAASRTGGPVPATAGDARQQLGDEVALYLDDGPRPAGPLSTVVDLTATSPRVLREGALPDERVLAVARGELDPLDAASEGLEPPVSDDAGDEPG